VRRSGTSFATPIVSGIVARLLSVQLAQGEKPNPHAIREAILKTVLPCNPEIVEDCRRFLAGTLNISGAYTLITKGGLAQVSDPNSEEVVVQPSQVEDFTPEDTSSINEIQQLEPSEAIAPSSEQVSFESPEIGIQAAEATNPESSMTTNIQHSENPMSVTSSNLATSNVTPSGDCGCNEGTVASSVTPSNAPMSLVYALGTIGYDFGTEARRDSFKQLMPMVWSDDYKPIDTPKESADAIAIPANPYDARQMVRYLEKHISEAASLIWTLNLELTPIYAIKPQDVFALEVYRYFQEFLAGQILDKEDKNHIGRVSIPAVLTGETVTLFSGQVLPVLAPLNLRGMYGWKVEELIDKVIEAIKQQKQQKDDDIPEKEINFIKYSLKQFLNRIYYDLRNLGQTSMDRAQNFAATNVFQYADVLVNILSHKNSQGEDSKAVTMELDGFEVERSPFCRKDSDCWDVKIKFFDPENNKRAKKVLRYTIDVSDIMPVTMGEPRTWDVAN
ncbi:MAG: PatA/PatG family cyanobactin maturation protease, partial [Symploca sp. SIO1B1]|nr:PatA/PatG family cyanobactin maturation protease [Symploca sp. SIO1B1]